VRPPGPAALAAKIARSLPIRSLPGPLGLRYHAAAPASNLSKISPLPTYWAHLWPGGAALIAALTATPALVRGRHVLDLGAGSGLVGLAAARLGASEVWASDPDPAAQAAQRLNAALNGLPLQILGDILEGPFARPALPLLDVILVGDLFYEPALAMRVMAFLGRARSAGSEVLVGDIGRAPLPRDRFTVISEHPVRDVGEAASTPLHTGMVLRLT
jgi:predicted nicotinamide N-methyase